MNISPKVEIYCSMENVSCRNYNFFVNKNTMFKIALSLVSLIYVGRDQK